MLIFAIDDEPRSLHVLHKAIAKAAPDAEIMDFPLGTEAIRAIEERGLRPQVVFSDIQMPELDGLRLAVRLKQASPETKLVFVTGYSEYALEAMRLHVNGYITKPVDDERVREELLYNVPEQMSAPDKLKVQCFGYFEVFWQGKPLMFGRRQTKELLAFLIDRRGAVCTAEEIVAVLWEDETDMSTAKHRLRQLISDLRDTLSAIGMDGVLVRGVGRVGILRDKVDCDFYRMLEGDMDALNRFHGEYMRQYSWAEMTEGNLQFGGIKGK